MIKQRKLSCGITVLHENIPFFRSCTLGIWVRAGSVIETENENGISHLIEHMMFKGTEKRDARKIAVDSDNIGGQLNAFTSKECTCYYIKVIDEKLSEAVELLSDIFLNSVFDAEELEKEKKVVLEEIAMYNDTPDDVVQEKVARAFFTGTALEKTILGPENNIKGFSRDDLFDYRKRLYNSANILISVAGNYDENTLFDALEIYFGRVFTDNNYNVQPLKTGYDPSCLERREISVNKDIEQAHICMSFPGCSLLDDSRYALLVANNIIGGSMSSRLFQRIREKSGMAYSVYSYVSSYFDAGMISFYAGTMLHNLEPVKTMMIDELDKVRKDGFTKDEFVQSKEQMKSNFLLSLESTSSKMSSIGKAFIITGRVRTEDEVLSLIESTEYDDVAKAVDEALDFGRCTFGVVGRID